MSIIKILPEHKSNTTIQFAPKRVFSSGSGGYTGSLNVIVNRSHTQKDSVDMREGLTNQEGPQKFSENTFEGRREMIYNARFNTVGQGNIFSEEKKGLVPSTKWKKQVLEQSWYLGETVITGIGQGYIQTTPLQLCLMTAQLANGGYKICLLYTSPSPRDLSTSRMPSSA